MRKFRAFQNKDPNPVQHRAVSVCIFQELLKNKITKSKRAIRQLGRLAFFFAERSSKYLNVPQSKKKRTDILRLRNIRFFRSGRLLSHLDPQLEYADYVTKMFEWKRKDNRMDTVTQMASGDRLLCPVRLDAVLVRRMRGYPGSSDNTLVSAVCRSDRIKDITSNEMVEALRATVRA